MSRSQDRPFESYHDVETRARKILPPSLADDVFQGSGDGLTAVANRRAFDDVAFVPRAGVGWPERDLSTSVLGTPMSMPVLLAPVGGLRLINPTGAPAAVRAASAAGVIAAVSMIVGHSVRDVAASTDGPLWQQVYLNRGRTRAERVIADARHGNYKALVVTIDCPLYPKKPVDLAINWRSAVQYGPELIRRPRWLAGFVRDGMSLSAANDALGPRVAETATWSDLTWMREQWTGPLVIKGVLSPEDARRAADLGANAVVVSNHGGMTIDGAPPSISRLSDVVSAVGDQVEVYLDGGIRRGADVLRAVALGARAVLIGRPYVAGLAVSGERGVAGVLEMMRAELDLALAMIGARSVADLDRSFVTTPVSWSDR